MHFQTEHFSWYGIPRQTTLFCTSSSGKIMTVRGLVVVVPSCFCTYIGHSQTKKHWKTRRAQGIDTVVQTEARRVRFCRTWPSRRSSVPWFANLPLLGTPYDGRIQGAPNCSAGTGSAQHRSFSLQFSIILEKSLLFVEQNKKETKFKCDFLKS